jgi:ATP-binding cassette subfamily B (MDR/TAP) protein 11
MTRTSTGSDFSSHEDERPPVIEDIEEQQPPPVSMMTILKKNMPEWPFILIGSLGAFVMGFAMPIFGVLFGDILGVSD